MDSTNFSYRSIELELNLHNLFVNLAQTIGEIIFRVKHEIKFVKTQRKFIALGKKLLCFAHLCGLPWCSG